MKQMIAATLLLLVSLSSFAQSIEAGTDKETIKQYMNNKDTIPTLR